MIELEKRYWIFIYPHVYVTTKKERLFLYNTQNGLSLETDIDLCLKLIEEIHQKQNLGTIELTEEYLNSSLCLNFIEEIIKKKIGNIKTIEDNTTKPIILLPILNLQQDIEKMKNNDDLFIGNNLLSYLSELNIFLNGKCNQNCKSCDTYFSQTNFCVKLKNLDVLKPCIIENILSQSLNSSVKNINILGGNLFLYPHWDELNSIIKKYEDYQYHYWVQYENMNHIGQFNALSKIFKLNILVSFPIKNNSVEKLLHLYRNNENITFHFLVENDEEYKMIDNWISIYSLNRYKTIPFYNGNNYSFFENYVFTEKKDLLASTIKMQREIFCNQKLNSNNFGKLYILPNGDVKANQNSPNIGNVHVNSILQIIYEELVKNTAWRSIRNSAPCTECLYQFLCPPLSNYETAIGKPNLCHIAKM